MQENHKEARGKTDTAESTAELFFDEIVCKACNGVPLYLVSDRDGSMGYLKERARVGVVEAVQQMAVASTAALARVKEVLDRYY